MDNFEKVEKLVEKTGVDYATAKEALEASEWDMLDAIIYLEGKGFSAKKADAKVETAEESTAIQKTNSQDYDYGRSACETCEKDSCEGCETEAQYKQAKKKQRRACKGKVKRFLVSNKLRIFNPQGNEVVTLPVWVAILLFVCTFWITTFVILLSFAFGYKYVLEGPELGKEGINKAVDAVRDTTFTIAKDIKEKCEEHKAER